MKSNLAIGDRVIVPGYRPILDMEAVVVGGTPAMRKVDVRYASGHVERYEFWELRKIDAPRGQEASDEK